MCGRRSGNAERRINTPMRVRPLASSWVRSYDQHAVIRAMMENHTPIPTWALPLELRARKRPTAEEFRRAREHREFLEEDTSL